MLTWAALIGIAILVVVLIVLMSAAPSWTQSGRLSARADWVAEPLWLGQIPDGRQALSSSASSVDPGGVSANW